MLRNYFLIALRNLFRNSIYSLINIGGLVESDPGQHGKEFANRMNKGPRKFGDNMELKLIIVFALAGFNSIAQLPVVASGSIRRFENFASRFVDARTIDVWLPIISPQKYTEKLENISSDFSLELANLLLCMYLVTQQPGNSSGIKEMQSPVYFEAKTLLTSLTSSGNTTIEVIQAGVLLSLYEQGHGMIDVAQLTMSVCTRMAMKMKVVLRAAPELQNTDFGRLWWGLIILDRLTFSRPIIDIPNTVYRHLNQILSPEEIQLTLGSSSDGIPSMELPKDDEADAMMNRPITMRTISGISAATRPATRLGPFCRASEASHLLGKVLDLVARSSYTNNMDEEQTRTLDKALQEQAMVLMQFAVNGWEECCAAIGLCLRYLPFSKNWS